MLDDLDLDESIDDEIEGVEADKLRDKHNHRLHDISRS